jgi:hypothetical protein
MSAALFFYLRIGLPNSTFSPVVETAVAASTHLTASHAVKINLITDEKVITIVWSVNDSMEVEKLVCRLKSSE